MHRTTKLLATTMIAAAGAITAALTLSATAAAEPAAPPTIPGVPGLPFIDQLASAPAVAPQLLQSPRLGAGRSSGCARRAGGAASDRQCRGHAAAAGNCARRHRTSHRAGRHPAGSCASHRAGRPPGSSPPPRRRHRTGSCARRRSGRAGHSGADGRGERAPGAVPAGAAASTGVLPRRLGFADARGRSVAGSGSQADSGRRRCPRRRGARSGRRRGPRRNRPLARAAAGCRAALSRRQPPPSLTSATTES